MKEEFDADALIAECIAKIKKLKSENSCNETLLDQISTSEHLEDIFTKGHTEPCKQ